MAKPKDRISIKRAKEICKEKFGKLPRCGYEMEIESGNAWGCHYSIFLMNEGGRYRVRSYESPMATEWEQYHDYPM